MHSRRIWKSSDYYLTSFLMARGMKVLGVEGQRPRCQFVLHDPDPNWREDAITDFRLGEDDQVSASSIIAAMKTLQRLLRDAD